MSAKWDPEEEDIYHDDDDEECDFAPSVNDEEDDNGDYADKEEDWFPGGLPPFLQGYLYRDAAI